MKGYKIIFSTDLSSNEIEERIDDLLREVDSRQAVAQVIEMSQEELDELVV